MKHDDGPPKRRVADQHLRAPLLEQEVEILNLIWNGIEQPLAKSRLELACALQLFKERRRISKVVGRCEFPNSLLIDSFEGKKRKPFALDHTAHR